MAAFQKKLSFFRRKEEDKPNVEEKIYRFECDPHVAKYIQNKADYRKDMKYLIQGCESTESINIENGFGIVTLRTYQKQHIPFGLHNHRERLLAKYLELFTSHEEPVQKPLAYKHFIEIVLCGARLRCFVHHDPIHNTVRITGKKEGVQMIIRKLQDLQRPIPSSTAQLPPQNHRITAFDPHVARFIKYSETHSRGLSEALEEIADVELVENEDGILEYRFLSNKEEKEEKFETSCESELKNFLEKFDCKIRHCNDDNFETIASNELRRLNQHVSEHSLLRNQLSKDDLLAHLAKKSDFVQQPKEKEDALFVRWCLKYHKVLLCGLQKEVKKKDEEINKLLEVTHHANDYFTNFEVNAFGGETTASMRGTISNQRRLEVVIKSKSLHRQLQIFCKDLCIVTGDSFPLKVFPTHPQNFSSFNEYKEKVVKQMQEFLYKKMETLIFPFNDEVARFFIENQEKWRLDHFHESDCAVLDFKPNGVEIHGIREDVKKYWKLVQDEVIFTVQTRDCNKAVCRILEACAVVDETNLALRGKLKVIFSSEEEQFSLDGRACYLDYACDKLSEKGRQLSIQPPSMSEEKKGILKKLLTGERETTNATFINEQLKEHSVKAILLNQDNEAVLIASTAKAFEEARNFINGLLDSASVNVSNNFLKDFVNKQDWINIVSGIHESKHVLVEIQANAIAIIGIKENVSQALYRVQNYMKKTTIVRSLIPCLPHVSSYIMKYSVKSKTEIASCIKVEETNNGLEVTGPLFYIEAAVKHLNGLALRSERLVFSSPNLESHFLSDTWKNFVDLLESGVKCNVSFTLKKSVHTSRTINRADSEDCEIQYGNILVSVCLGDVTKDDSDVIINGVTSDFNLSRGTLSSAVLQAAGSKIQKQCNLNPLSSCSNLRVSFGWRLLCTYVIHLVIPYQLTLLPSFFKKALDQAEKLNQNSVSIPTLGAGGVGYSCQDVASAMSEAFKQFADGQPKHVKLIKVLVYEEGILDTFAIEMIKHRGLTQHQTEQTKSDQVSTPRRTTRASRYSDNWSDKEDEIKEKMHSRENHITILITAENENDFEKAKSKIRDHMEKEISTKTITDEMIPKLDCNDRIDIYQKATYLQVMFECSMECSPVTIRGLNKDVQRLYDYIVKLLCELREAITLSETVYWKWAKDQSSDFTSFPLRVGMAIEKKYKKNKKGSDLTTMFGKPVHLDFAKYTFRFNNATCFLKRLVRELPSDWTDMMEETIQKIPLNPLSEEFNRVTALFSASKPVFVVITSIKRIQHPSLYRRYLISKGDVERHSTNPVQKELFHGTCEEDAKKICAQGFDRNFAGKNATVYGKGTYFAVNSSYSVQYAMNSTSPIKCVFLAKVLTGDFCQGRSDMKAPPTKGDSTVLYDSVVDNVANPSMFVVFKDSSAYPYYLISFI